MGAPERRAARLHLPAACLCVLLGVAGAWGQSCAFAGVFEDGEALLRAGDYRQALEKLREAVGESPYDAERRRYLAEAYERLGDVPAAMQQYRHILRLAPRSGAAAAARAALAALGEPAVTRIEVAVRRAGNAVLLPARVNGEDLGAFVLDTGATFITISRSAAARLGLATGDRMVRLHTASGTVEAPLTLLRDVQVGDAGARDVQAVVHDVPNLPASVVGLLGMSFLERFRMNLDVGAGVLVLERDP
jgi:clan AA aspartic protease (TIGR02281 family)